MGWDRIEEVIIGYDRKAIIKYPVRMINAENLFTNIVFALNCLFYVYKTNLIIY